MKIDISKEDADYMYSIVERIINEVGPRMPCSPQEVKGAEIIRDELVKTCDDATLESFTCHPKAFLGWIKLDCIMVFISMILYLVMQLITNLLILQILAVISFSLVVFAIWIIKEEFFNYREFIDPLFREKPSQNVIGRLKAKGELKNIIIFSSHNDSALEFKLAKRLGWGWIPLALGGILIMLVWFIISFLNLLLMIIGYIIHRDMFLLLSVWLLIIGTPCFIALFFFVPLGDKGNVVPGACDNLSSCSVIIGLGRYLKENKEIIPNNTEIRLISFGCEEAGLRGAYRYAAAHIDELKKLNTMVFNMDGLDNHEFFRVIEYEPTTKTKHSEEVVQKIQKAAQDIGINVKRFGAGKLEKTVGRLSGGSDAAAFSKANLKAAFLMAADFKNRGLYYHQSTDTLEKIQVGTLENALRICIAFIMNEKKGN
jgi:hypothetical protein